MPSTYALPTLASLRTLVRQYLDDQNAGSQFWADSELNAWINDACRDIARRSEDLQTFNTSITVVINQTKYVLPIDIVRVHRVEFVPTAQPNQAYAMMMSNYEQMDQVWGYQQNTQSSYPSYATFWQTSPITMQVFPAPAQAGSFNIFYFRLPQVMTADGDTADIPAGWDDLVCLFCSAMAKLKDHDPQWREMKQEYELRLQNLVDVSRYWHDQANTFNTPTSPWLPSWLWSSGSYY